MFNILLLWMALNWSATTSGQTFFLSLGDLQQYTAQPTTTPVLNGTSILYVDDTVAGGIDVFLSPDLHSNISSGVNLSCPNLTQDCVQEIENRMINPDTEIQSRSLVVLGTAFLATVVAIILEAIRIKQQPIPAYVYVPANQLSQESNVAGAIITVVSVDTFVEFTMTAQPPPTGITGSAPPAVTTFTTAIDGHSPGDVLFSLPGDLAPRMEDFIRRSTVCDAGHAFDSGSTRKRSDGSYGAMLCAAEAVIINSAPNGPFGDFRLLNAPQLPFTAADAVRAMNAAMDFARAYAPTLNLDPNVAADLGVSAFAMAWEVLSNGQHLGNQNIIPATALSGTITAAPSSSSTTTTTCSVCLADCYFVGWLQVCGTTCTEASSCTGTSLASDVDGGGEQISTTAIVAWTVYAGNITATNTANIPLNTFSTSTLTSSDPESQLPSSTSSSPSTEPTTPLSTASFLSPINATPPPPIPPPSPTTSSTSQAPLPTATLGVQNCNSEDSYPHHQDISESVVKRWLNQIVCAKPRWFNSATPPFEWTPTGFWNQKLPYHYRVSWIPGCEIVTSQWLLNPLPDQQEVMCYSLLYEDYKNCINGGVGGWRDVGCLRYEQNPMTS